jgi:hypothetical protein
VRVALAVGLALLASAVVVVLSRSPLIVVGTNSVPAHPEVAYVEGGFSTCEIGGMLPQGTSAIRVSASANTGPRVTLKALSGPLLVTSGHRETGWGVDETVTVPVKRVPRTISDAKICLAFGPVIEELQINGAVVRTTTAGGKTHSAVALRLEYLRPGHESWWSLASSVARHMGLGHAPSGTWVVLLLIALMITVAALAAHLVLRELR